MTTKPESAKEYPLNYHSPCGCFLSLHGYDEAGDPIVETIKECPKCTSQSLKAGDANCNGVATSATPDTPHLGNDPRSSAEPAGGGGLRPVRFCGNGSVEERSDGEYYRREDVDRLHAAMVEASTESVQTIQAAQKNEQRITAMYGQQLAGLRTQLEAAKIECEQHRMHYAGLYEAEKQRADNAERIANQIAHKLDDAKVENYRLRKALEEIRDFDGYWQSNGE